jgi:ABC-type phosphate/phosphonate transport system ATPase subunit
MWFFNADQFSGGWDSCAAAKLAEQFMLIEEHGLTVVKSCHSITLHRRICNPITKIKDGKVWLMFARHLTVQGITAETQRLDWSLGEMRMIEWVCVESPGYFVN